VGRRRNRNEARDHAFAARHEHFLPGVNLPDDIGKVVLHLSKRNGFHGERATK
jgi:hypothetical protein